MSGGGEYGSGGSVGVYLDADDPPLMHAAFHNNLRQLQSCLCDEDQVADINDTNIMGYTALRLAATVGNTEACRMLIEAGGEVDVLDRKAQTPLAIAIRHHKIDTAKCLLEHGASPDGSHMSVFAPLHTATFEGDAEAVQLLVEHGAVIDKEPVNLSTWISTPLYACVTYHYRRCFTILLQTGIDPDFYCKLWRPDNDPGRFRSAACQSLYFAVIHHDCDIEYAELLYVCGASLYFRDNEGRLPCDVDKDNQVKAFISSLYGHVRSLLDQCRLAIRQSLGRHRMRHIPALPVPAQLHSFLALEGRGELGEEQQGRFYQGWGQRHRGPQPLVHGVRGMQM